VLNTIGIGGPVAVLGYAAKIDHPMERAVELSETGSEPRANA